MNTTKYNLVMVDRDEYEKQYPGKGMELVSTYCSGCNTTQKEVGTFRCNGNGEHVPCDLLK